MVLETVARDVLARAASWSPPSGHRADTPLLLECRSTGLPGETSGCAAALTGAAAGGPGPLEGDGALVVRDLGSVLRPAAGGAGWAHIEVPADLPVPPSIARELEGVPLLATGRDGVVEIVHLPAKGPPGPPAAEATELVVLGSAAALAGRHVELVDAVLAARARAGPARLLYAPGLATPQSLALLAYMGVDVVDDVRCHVEAARGVSLRPELPPPSPWGPGGAVYGPTLPQDDGVVASLASASVLSMRRELAVVTDAIRQGWLRELVEQRVRTEPWQVAALRHLDHNHHADMVAFAPARREARLLAVSRDAFHRVEVRAWVDRLIERYTRPPSARVLVLLPCSARKPYSGSRTHRALLGALRDVRNRWALHEVILTSPLGAVPRELERCYPAAHYDIPVTGEWFPEELERMSMLLAHLRREGRYEAVISHMGDALGFLAEDEAVVRTRLPGEGPLDAGALARLTEEAGRAASRAERVDRRARDLEDLASLARFQFGPEAAAALLDGARLAGKPPEWRLASAGGAQLAAFVADRGALSLTLEGVERIASTGRYRVHMDDFELKGNLFAVGVTGADVDVREGDDVAVVHGDRVVAVGVARMCATEMRVARRGIAVAVRHRRGGGR